MAKSYCWARGNMPSYKATASHRAQPRQRQGDHAGQRLGGHGGQVAQVRGQGLSSHAARIDLGQLEIDVVGQQVHGNDALVEVGHPQHGGVVARSQPQPRMRREMLAEPGDELAFHNGHLASSMAAARTKSDNPLNPFRFAVASNSTFSSEVSRTFTWAVRVPSRAGVGGRWPSSTGTPPSQQTLHGYFRRIG